MRGRIIDCCVTLKHNKLQLRNYITMYQSCQMPLWCSVSRNVGMLQEQSILFFYYLWSGQSGFLYTDCPSALKK